MLDMEKLLATVAQVSFTAIGLLLVVLAGDTDSRRFWFSHEYRSLHARATLLPLLLPGFVSVGALIPPVEVMALRVWRSRRPLRAGWC